MKIPNCSTWNKIKTKFFRASVCLAFSLSLVATPISAALAAPAVVPVAAESVYALLVALGLMVGNEIDGFTWVGNGNSYTDSIFNTASPGFTSGTKSLNENLDAALAILDNVMAENVYTTDGTNFYASGKKVTPSDLFLSAKSLVGVTYSIPVNINGASASTRFSNSNASYFLSPFSSLYAERQSSIFSYFGDSAGNYYISDLFVHFISSGSCDYQYLSKFDGTNLSSPTTYPTDYPYICGGVYSSQGVTLYPFLFAKDTSLNNTQSVPYSVSTAFVNLSTGARVNLKDFWSNVTSATIIDCNGLPSLSVDANAESLEGAIVQVKPSDDDDNNGSTPPVPQSPDGWEIWKTLTDLTKFLESGEITNGGTTFDEYVNNNYNYVEVNINVPNEQNINISGGLDINGNGTVDITIHDEVSLPSVGDGSGFFNPSAVNVIGALAEDNPVVSVVSGLFSAIDPALVGIFSVSVSLLLVLGLWKLIRG